jgi:hypothetical protein
MTDSFLSCIESMPSDAFSISSTSIKGNRLRTKYRTKAESRSKAIWQLKAARNHATQQDHPQITSSSASVLVSNVDRKSVNVEPVLHSLLNVGQAAQQVFQLVTSLHHHYRPLIRCCL